MLLWNIPHKISLNYFAVNFKKRAPLIFIYENKYNEKSLDNNQSFLFISKKILLYLYNMNIKLEIGIWWNNDITEIVSYRVWPIT